MADSTTGVRPGKTAATTGKGRSCRKMGHLTLKCEYRGRSLCKLMPFLCERCTVGIAGHPFFVTANLVEELRKLLPSFTLFKTDYGII